MNMQNLTTLLTTQFTSEEFEKKLEPEYKEEFQFESLGKAFSLECELSHYGYEKSCFLSFRINNKEGKCVTLIQAQKEDECNPELVLNFKQLPTIHTRSPEMCNELLSEIKVLANISTEVSAWLSSHCESILSMIERVYEHCQKEYLKQTEIEKQAQVAKEQERLAKGQEILAKYPENTDAEKDELKKMFLKGLLIEFYVIRMNNYKVKRVDLRLHNNEVISQSISSMDKEKALYYISKSRKEIK